MRPVTPTSSSTELVLHPTGRLSTDDHTGLDRRTCRTYFLRQIKKMRSWLLSLCMLTVVVSCLAQYHNNRYENFNADAVIQNDRILLAYYKCVMDKGPCTKDGKNFKRVLPETLSTACGRCSSLQKLVVRKLLLGIKAKSELRFIELLDKYDPDRANRDALYNFLATGA